MENKNENEEPTSSRFTDYLANERTFLAWIRTSIGIMAFGFVVEKFALFIKQISLFLGQGGHPATIQAPSKLQGHSELFGIFLVALGAFIGLFSFIKYKRVQRQLEQGKYQPSTLLEFMLILSVLSMGTFLIAYLMHSI